MKKTLSLIIAFLLCASLFSASSNFVKYAPYPREYRAMGEAGLSLKGSERGFFVNPASLSTDDFSLVLPSLEVGIGSVSDIATIPFSSLEKLDADAIGETLGKVSGSMPILTAKSSISFSLFGFGAAFDLSGGVFTSGEGFAAGLVPFMKVAGTLGYGRSFVLSEKMDLEVGASAHTNLFFYSSPIGVSSLSATLVNGLEDNIRMNLSSLYFSVDVGSTLRLKSGFAFGVTLSDMGKDLMIEDIVTETGFYVPFTSSLGVGASWERVFWKWLGVKAALDVKDLGSLFSSPSFPSLLYHTNMGMALSLSKSLELMCGLKGGYPSFGADFKLFFIDLSLLYTVDEYSDKVGYNPRDTLSLIVRLEF